MHAPNRTWNDDRDAFIKKHWQDGASANEIAKALRRAFGLDVSRNAVIGRIHRLGAGNRAQPSRPMKAPKVERSNVRPPRPPAGSAGGRAAVVHASGYRKAASEDAAAVRAERLAVGQAALARVALSDIESPNARPFLEAPGIGFCKWPIGEGLTMLACCNPTARGSYCADHANIAYTGLGKDQGSSMAAPSTIERLAIHHTRFERTDGYRPVRAANSNRPRSVWDEGRDAA